MFKPEVRDFIPSVSVVGDQFCFPYVVNLIVKKKTGLLSKHIDVLDDNRVLLLQVDGGSWQFKKKRTMFDSFGVPVITLMRQKAISWRQQWMIHRGERIDGNNLQYMVQKSQSFQLKTQLEVFLASNLMGEVCDFRVIGSYISKSFKVYQGDILIAEVKERFKLGSLGKESFEARIYPGIDYAFIVSLLVILTETD